MKRGAGGRPARARSRSGVSPRRADRSSRYRIGGVQPVHTITGPPMRLALALCLALASVSASAQAVQIAGIRVALISDHDGSLTPTSTDGVDLDLTNVIIGDPPSHATLVTVDLAGRPGSSGGTTGGRESVTLTARTATARRVVSRQTATIGSFSESGRSVAVFVVQDTGCEALQITASVGRGGRGRRAEVTVPFACGE